MECIKNNSVSLGLGGQPVSLHEVLAVGVGPLVHCPAQEAGDVEEADGEAGVEGLNWCQGYESVDQLGRDENDLRLGCLGLEDLSGFHDVEPPHEPQHQLVHPVVSIPGQAPQGELQLSVGPDPGSQDDLDSDDVEELPQEIERHGQQEGFSQGERLLRQIQIIVNDAPSEKENQSINNVTSNTFRTLPDKM